MRTVCLTGKTAAKRNSTRDVVPFRQQNRSNVDYCYCPRGIPSRSIDPIVGAQTKTGQPKFACAKRCDNR
jgi:hypothetical protein